MTLADVLPDAIHYARRGLSNRAGGGLPLASIAGAFLHSAANAEEYLPNGVRRLKAGQVVRLPGLASSLRAIAEGGPDAFYTRSHRRSHRVSRLQEQGGVMTLEDLKNHHSTWDEPIKTDYRGLTIYECPPNGQGLDGSDRAQYRRAI